MIASPTIAGVSQMAAAGALAQSAAFEDSRVYKKVCLEKNKQCVGGDAEILGLTIVETVTGIFEVQDVRCGGMVDRFNKVQNNVPEKMIIVGDKIVAVNGVTGDLNAMKVELFAQRTVNLVLKHAVKLSDDVKVPAERPTLLTSARTSHPTTEAIKVPATQVLPHTDATATTWQRQTTAINHEELQWSAPKKHAAAASTVTLMEDNDILPLEEQCEEAEKANCQVCACERWLHDRVRCVAY